jgi:hypothetical protein
MMLRTRVGRVQVHVGRIQLSRRAKHHGSSTTLDASTVKDRPEHVI